MLFSSPAAVPRPLAAPASLCTGAEKAGGWVAQGWFLPGKREAQGAGDIGSRRASWSGGCRSRLGRRVCKEGREEKVGGNWQRERKQRRIVSSVQGDVCAIPAVISRDLRRVVT